MGCITMDDIKNALGRKYNDTSTYTLQTHSTARTKLASDLNLKRVGEMQDFSGEGNTMIILELPDPDKPQKTGIISRLTGA